MAAGVTDQVWKFEEIVALGCLGRGFRSSSAPPTVEALVTRRRIRVELLFWASCAGVGRKRQLNQPLAPALGADHSPLICTWHPATVPREPRPVKQVHYPNGRLLAKGHATVLVHASVDWAANPVTGF